MSMAITRRPALASSPITERKSSLLPVKPGISSAGERSQTPVAGSASSAANAPRLVSIVTRRAPSGSSSVLGVLIFLPPSRALGLGPRWLREAWGSGGLPPGPAESRRREAAARSDAAFGPAPAACRQGARLTEGVSSAARQHARPGGHD